MNKLYGGSIFVIGGLLSLLFLAMPIIQIASGEFRIGGIIYSIAFLLPLFLLLKRALKILKNQIEIIAPASLIKQAGFYLGGILLAISVVIVLITLFIILQVAISGSAGGPVGMGLGFALLPLMAGATLVEMYKASS